MMNHMTIHIPVLLNEILDALQPAPGSIIVDGTFGGGGHSKLLAPKVIPGGKIIGIDRDPLAVERAADTVQDLPIQLVTGNYADIPEILADLNIASVDGILLDLGLSSDQLADQNRGFSYQSEGPLDLRFDSTQGDPAWKLVHRLSEKHLANLIYEFGEERYSRRLAAAIVKRRQNENLKSAAQIAQLIRKVVPRSRHHAIDPATRTFQALRIAVNEELKWLSIALRRLPDCLKSGGRIAVISFHSLEDRIAKNALRENESLELITKKPIRPSESEIESNPRSRSSRLRVAQKK
jgi:16S rRNA (cytosine1402-N4)-methyltransferase